MMKIAINARLLIEGKMAGEANYLYALLQEFAHQDKVNEYHLLFDRPYSIALFDFLKGNPRFYFHVLTPMTRIFPLLNYWFQVSVRKFVQRNSIDVLFSPEPYGPIAMRTRCIITIHDLAFLAFPRITYWMNSLNARLMIRWSARSADHIIAVSRHTSGDIQKFYGTEAKKITVIHHGIKTATQQVGAHSGAPVRIFIPDGVPYVLYVGTIEPRKNLIRTVEAFAELVQRGVPHTLIIAGRYGWKNKELYERIEQLGLRDRVVFTGYVSELELRDLYSKAEIFVYIPLYEGFGMPVSEAMSFGLPIVTSNVSSLPEVVGEAAVTVDPTNISEITEAIGSLLGDKQRREQLGNAARERSLHFSWERSAKEHLSIICSPHSP